MPRRSKQQLGRRRRRNRRGRGNRGSSGKHTLTYSSSCVIENASGVRSVTARDFGVDISRPCRIKSIRLVYSSQKTSGLVLSYTCESAVSKDDATARSTPLQCSQFSRSYMLRNPSSTDFAYINKDQPITEITVYNAPTTPVTSQQVFLLFTLTMEFMPSQPFMKDLGILPPNPSYSPLDGSPYSEI